jgi:opacity protein-like surface antigen
MSFSNLGASAGLFGGFRAPVGQALAGVELAGQVSAVKAEGMQGFGLPDGNFGSVGKVGARATLGLPVDRYLPYVAIGAALSFQHYTPFAGRNTAVAHPSLEAAIGLDYAFTDKMFGRLEASYTGLSSENYNIGLGQWRVSPHGVVEVRAGVGLSFN